MKILAGLLLTLLSSTSFGATNQQGPLHIKDFNLSPIGAKKYRIKISALSENNIKVESFLIRLESIPLNAKVNDFPGFKNTNNFPYLISTDFKDNPFLLKDNGSLDKNMSAGIFETILDCSDWPAGKYKIKVFISNRPALGTYYFDSKQDELVVENSANSTIAKSIANRDVIETNIVWKSENIYAAFPTLDKLSNGYLLTTFATRKYASHVNPEGGTMTMLSKDNGRTWLKSNSNLINEKLTTRKGELISIKVGGWKYDLIGNTAKLKKEGKTTMVVGNGQIAWLDNTAYVNISSDNGKTWNKKNITVPNDIKGLFVFQTLRTKNGTWIVSMYGPRINKAKNINSENEVYFLRSGDDGKTWNFIYQTPAGLKKSDMFNETNVIKLLNGEILAMQRSGDTKGLFVSRSKDGGKTWTYPKDTGIWGYPADMIQLSDGRIVCAYGYRRPPMGIRACFSRDNGRTWDLKNEIIIRSDADVKNIGDLGYPKVTQLPNGELFFIYYIATDEKMPFIASSRLVIKK